VATAFIETAPEKLGFVIETEFDRIFDPKKMVKPYVASAR
jgi:hypothetical protein